MNHRYRWNEPASDKQIQLAIELGYDEDKAATMTKAVADAIIPILIDSPLPSKKQLKYAIDLGATPETLKGGAPMPPHAYTE